MPDKFYTNKEIYEKFTQQIEQLSKELERTNNKFHTYNGINDRLDDVDESLEIIGEKLVTIATRQTTQENKCKEVLARQEGQSDTWSQLARVWPIVIQTGMAAFTIWIALRAGGG